MSTISRRQFGGMALLMGAGAHRLFGATTIDMDLEDSLERQHIPAAAAMVATADKTIYEGAFGTRDSTSAVRVTTASIFDIASMTKAVTSVAAMQLVEQGRMVLDVPASKYLPELEKPNILEGFDKAGKPMLRPAVTPVTLRHLLSHSSGYAYDTWNENMYRYTTQVVGNAGTAYPTSLWGRAPLPVMFEPGTGWQYGPSADWAARLVEVVSGQRLDRYFQTNIFDPLEMKDTSYFVPAAKLNRVVSQYERQSDGVLKELPRKQQDPPKVFWGGSGLKSTVGDYTRFMQMILRHGAGADNQRILQAKTVGMMSTNQIGKISAGTMRNFFPAQGWHDIIFHPGFTDGFSLGFLVNATAYKGGRSAGSLAWAGGWNSFYWIDPPRGLCAVIMMQFQPFYDRAAVEVLKDFERLVYQSRRNGD